MMAKTHIAFATTLLFIPIVISPQIAHLFSTDIILLPIIILSLIVGSLFPDIDEPNSTISNKFFLAKPLSLSLKLFGLKHRGFTHKFIFFLIFLFIALLSFSLVDKNISIALLFFSFGIFAHQLGDMMVGAGVHKGGIYNYFSPFYSSNSTTKFLPFFMRCKINGIKEKLYLVVFSLFSFMGLYLTLVNASI
ncbi:MAG: metal-dependent hydrolase [Sulfurimonas sp.]|nr:metal-dependent hydrolase [Sulfurimonas sp.]